MSKVFVPELKDYTCFEIHDNYIRGYKGELLENEFIDYTDIYFNNNYYIREGTTLLEVVPVCINQEDLTTNFYYRVDFYKILIIFLILAIFIIYLPLKLISKIFKRRL